MLQIAGIEHEMILTTSESFIEDWINNLDIEQCKYTDIVLIGGDGMFNQLLNAIYKHPNKDQFLKISIGLMPGGSQNAIACDLGGKSPYLAAIKILKGNIIKGDIMKITFEESKEVIYGTSCIWGLPSHIVSQAQNWRTLFKSARYGVCAVRNFLLRWNLMRYQCKIEYKYDEESLKTKSNNLNTNHINNDKISYNFGINKFKDNNKQIEFEENKECQSHNISKDIWKQINNVDFLFFVILTHEARSSLSEEIFLPFARMDDSKMYLSCIERLSKLNALKLFKNLQSGKHVDMKEFSCKEVTELKISPQSNMFFTIDGEVYPCDGMHIQLIPSAISLLGKTYSVSAEWNEKKKLLLH